MTNENLLLSLHSYPSVSRSVHHLFLNNHKMDSCVYKRTSIAATTTNNNNKINLKIKVTLINIKWFHATFILLTSRALITLNLYTDSIHPFILIDKYECEFICLYVTFWRLKHSTYHDERRQCQYKTLRSKLDEGSFTQENSSSRSTINEYSSNDITGNNY